MKPRGDDDLNEEIDAHLRMAVDERVARGESRADAERAARREFGNVGHVKEVTRDMRAGVWFERLRQDIRYSLRALRRTPAFTIVAVLTLAIGIGANSAMFTVVNGVLLRPLPFAEPSRLFLVSYLPENMPMEAPPSLVDRTFPVFRERTRLFERVASFTRAAVTLTGAGDATRLSAARTSADFFRVLGIEPQRGRVFAADEERAGHEHVVVLSDGLWRERFAGGSAVVGRTVTLDGSPHVVVGVMPPGFDFPSTAQLWTPLVYRLDPGNSWMHSVVGRLRSTATPPQARDELESIMSNIPPDPRDRGQRMAARIVPLQELVTGKIEKSLLIFSAAVAFVLLIACANVANLLLIRAAARRREMAVRAALGASRTRLVRQLLTESTLVAVIGGALGIVVALVGVRALLAVAPDGRIPRAEEIRLDGWVLAFTLGVSLVTGLAFGLVPAFHGARRSPRESLSSGTRTVTGAHSRLRGGLVMAEIALALVLLAGAGLMVKSFLRMRAVDTGFVADHVVTMSASLPSAAYGEVPRLHAFHTATIERLARIPGVLSAGAVSWRPLSGVGIMGDFHSDGATPVPSGFMVHKPSVSPGYFRTMGIRLLDGRDFSWRDDASAAGIAIVSQSVARRVWPNQDPIGKRITMADRPRPQDWLTVVGVVNDVVQAEFRPHAAIYLPYLQMQRTFFIDQMTYAVRTTIEPRSVMRAMRDAMRDVDANIAPQELGTMNELLTTSTAEPLFQTRLLTIFSLLALVLAAIGTYGVLAYDVSERTHEIGLRMALGATPGNVMRMIMRRTLMLAVPGVAIGLAGAVAVTGVLTKSLYDVTPTDPSTLVAVAVSIVLVALLAGFVPARRATRVEPLTALPHD